MYCRPSALAKEVANFFAYRKEINILINSKRRTYACTELYIL